MTFSGLEANTLSLRLSPHSICNLTSLTSKTIDWNCKYIFQTLSGTIQRQGDGWGTWMITGPRN